MGAITIKSLNAVISAVSVPIYNSLESAVYRNTLSQNEATINTSLSIGPYIFTVSTETCVSDKSNIEK